ncbi:MAG: beta-glycosidase, partial [Promicromonosporaceae bacterium]|nr:beta-glycosidase [Promicromonosporaceae bacterium]
MIRHLATTEANPWVEQPAPAFGAPRRMPASLISTADRLQEIEGFGATFNELGWDALNLLDAETRAAAFDELFAPGDGLGLTRCRMPLGANDFSRDWYSYDETPGDHDLADFSIANDLDTLVPFIREAKARQPELTLWASPWSPPTWMKNNGHYACAKPRIDNRVDNGIRDDQVRAENTDTFLVDDEQMLATYARYFGAFIDAYRALGIEVDTVMPQNEWNSAQPFPSCTWTPEGLAAFVRHLGPQMQARGVDVFLGTLERADFRQVERVLADSRAARWIKGVGAQWAG